VTLPNLSRLLAYPDAARDAAALIAAAPQMADLLVGLDEYLDKCGCIPRTEAVCVGCRVLARLADFDKELT